MPVRDEDGPIGVDKKIVQLDHRLAPRGGGDEARDLDRCSRVAGVVDTQTGAEVRRVHDRVALECAGPVLVEVVRSEPEAVRRPVLGHRERRDLAGRRLIRDVDDMDVLLRARAIGVDRLIRRDDQTPIAEGEGRVSVGMPARAIGPVDLTQRGELPVVDAEHDDTRVEPARVGPVTAHDRVVTARIPARRADPRIRLGAPLLGKVKLRMQPRPFGIGDVDGDERPTMDAREAGGRVRVPAAGPPDPVHAEARDLQEADPPGIVRARDVVYDDPGAFRIGEVVRVALVVHEQQPVGVLGLMGVRSSGGRQLRDDARPAEIRDVDHARADAEVTHVPHVKDVAVAHDLHPVASAGEVTMSDELEAAFVQDRGQLAHAQSLRQPGLTDPSRPQTISAVGSTRRPKTTRSTIVDVAKAARVHPSTVSRALSDLPGHTLRPETRARVRSIVDRMGYRPSALARSLRLRRTLTLGMLVPDIANNFLAGIIKGAEEAAHESGYTLILCNTADLPEREATYIRVLRDREVDGVLVASTRMADATIDGLREDGFPFVLVNRGSGRTDDLVVTVDNSAAAAIVVDHLVARGHRHIAHIAGPRSTSTGLERALGAQDAARRHGVRAVLLEAEAWSEHAGYRAACQLLRDEPPTAIFGANDLIAVGALRAATEAGIRVPRDMAVAGFNDSAEAGLLDLTTIHVPQEQMGMRAAQLLLARLEGQTIAQPRVVIPIALVVRGSTATMTERRIA